MKMIPIIFLSDEVQNKFEVRIPCCNIELPKHIIYILEDFIMCYLMMGQVLLSSFSSLRNFIYEEVEEKLNNSSNLL